MAEEAPPAFPEWQPVPEPSPPRHDVLPIRPTGVPWRARLLGRLTWSDNASVWAILVIGIVCLLAFAEPLYTLATLPFSAPPEPAGDFELTPALFTFFFLVNTIVFLVLPLSYVALTKRGRWHFVWAELRLRIDRRTPLWFLLGAGATLAMGFVFGLLLTMMVALGWIPEPEQSPLVDAIAENLTWFLVFFIPVFAAVTEEVFFRGILQPRIGLWASSILFGIVHLGYGTWLQVVAPLALGLFFGLLYLWTRSLWTPIAGHFGFDLVQLVLLKTEPAAVAFLASPH